MTRLLRRTFLPLIAAAAWSSAQAAEVRDHAGMFSPKAVQEAQEELTRVERLTKIPIVIETIDALPGLEAGASHDEKMRAVNALAVKRDRDIKDEGVYILLSKKDRVFSDVLVGERYAAVLTEAKRRTIGNAFLKSFKAGDYDGGLAGAADALVAALPDGPVAVAGRRRAGDAGPVRARGAQPHGIGSLLTIGLGIVAVLFVVRLLSGLFGGRGAAGGYPQQMGGMQRPGMGPGFGGPGYGGGYGGRGGGFFSSMMGGIGGAVAGNWLYDQFSGRHSQGHVDSSNYNSGDATDPGGDGITGGDGNSGGGDWGDSGSGGGGGDWGGGGGDWGGGGGGGDWGGGDGGSW